MKLTLGFRIYVNWIHCDEQLDLQSSMLVLLSPSKTLSFQDAPAAEFSEVPVFIEASDKLMDKLKRLNAKKIEGLMSVNAGIAAQTAEWARNWNVPFSTTNARPAAHCFKGAVYTGLRARTWSEADRAFAQQHLRILSGLYGILKPLDLIQPYRLEMGLKWDISAKIGNLYSFWGDRIRNQVESESDGLIINLASKEYSKSAISKDYEGRIITPAFKELVGTEYKAKMAYAKEARGTMARFIVQNQWTHPNDFKQFNGMGYSYNSALSTTDNWVFTRDVSTTK